MTLRRLIIAMTFIAIFAMAARVSMDTDTWWHLRSGQWILEHRSVPKSDIFSSTRLGETWRGPSASSLSQVTLYSLYKVGGPGALNMWVALIVTASFIFIYFTLSGGPFLRAFVLILAAAASGVYWAARPHMMSFLLSAVFLWVLEDYRWGRKDRLYLLPIGMLLWVNSHPGFAIGFIIFGLYGLARGLEILGNHTAEHGLKLSGIWERLREGLGPMLSTGVWMLLAASVNPSGPALLFYPFETLSIGVLRDFIQEWQSPNFHRGETQPFLWLLLLTITTLGASRRRASWSEILVLTAFAYMGLLAGRNIVLFALAAPAALTRHAQPLLDEVAQRLKIQVQTERTPTRAQAWLNGLLLTLAFTAAGLKAANVLPAAVNEEVVSRNLPVGAVDYLRREEPAGGLLNSYNWGGYLIWALPEYPVFVDGRTDLYSDELLTTWLDIVRAEPGWQAELQAREINLVLLEPNLPLIPALEDEHWRLLYEDEVAVLYERTDEGLSDE